jgi:2-polyprenyl-6-hydroxyphenyl methylase/3-demethylubiquinone-9 3-methyltransferase
MTSGASPLFLEHVRRTITHAHKARILTRHYDTIAREMQRLGTWNGRERLLDVGCGIGLYSEFWHARGMDVTGVDIDADQVSYAAGRAREQGWNIRYQVASGERLPFRDASFDIVYANSLLEHVEQWESCLVEWVRMLAPGGLLWVETTNVLCPKQGEFRWLPLFSWWPASLKAVAVRAARGRFPALANHSPCPALHWFSFFQLEDWFKARGLAVRDRFDCLDLAAAGLAKRAIRTLALSSRPGRYLAYLLISPLVVIATRPA